MSSCKKILSLQRNKNEKPMIFILKQQVNTVWNILFVWILMMFNACSLLEKQTSDIENPEVAALLELYRDSLHLNPKATINVLSEAKSHIKDSVDFYTLLMYIAKGYYCLNDFGQALDLDAQALNFCNRKEMTPRLSKLKADALNFRGVVFQQNGYLDSTLVYLSGAYDLSSSIDICINLADCYHQKGNYPLSGFYYRKALFAADSLKLGENYYYSVYSGMAKLYQDLENFALADQYFEQAAMYQDKSSLLEKFFFSNTRGNFYYTTKAYKKAIRYFQEAAQLAETLEQSFSQAIAETNLGEIYILSGQADSARFYLDHSTKLFGDMMSSNSSVKFYSTGLYASLALLEGNLSEAEKLLLQPYDTALINPQYVYFHNRRMQELYVRKQDYEKAYFYRSEAEVYNDSLRNLKVRNNIADIDFRYSQDTTLLKKNIQIAYVETTALRWKNVALWSLLFFALVISLAVWVFVYRKKTHELQEVRQRSIITGLRMEIIRNRLSPHFMFNALNVVMPNLRKYGELETPFRLLIQMLRDNLRASEHIAIPLKQEIELVKNFLQFCELKNPGQIRTDWEISPETPLETLIPSMSIQIPVENAVKYAFRPGDTAADARILISITVEMHTLHIRIEDNGVGYNPACQTDDGKGTGSGLKMLQRTIESLNASNSRRLSFDIKNRHEDVPPAQGTSVLLVIPLNYNYSI
jgi:tetratricopeptide (TPR) repeat protein